MTYYLVQQWWVLPDPVQESHPIPGFTYWQPRHMSSAGPPGPGQARPEDNVAYFPPGLPRPGSNPSSPLSAPFFPIQGRGGESQPGLNMTNVQQGQLGTGPEGGDANEGGGAFSMESMAASLPHYRSGQAIPLAQSVSRIPQGSLPNHLSVQQQQQQHIPQFAGQTSPGGQGHSPSHLQFLQSDPQMQSMPQQNYVMHQSGGQNHPGYPGGYLQHSFPTHPYHQAQQQPHSPSPPYMYYQQAYGQVNPAQFQGSRQHSGYSGHGGFSPGLAGFGMQSPVGQGGMPGQRFNHSPSKAAIPSAPRGPPRKPKQSGHALWVGNLPPGALVQDLKDHFSRDATNDIESVFLISKSNCAFVNYRTEAACAAAMTRFHDTRFQGLRLVCRYRGTAATASSPTAPAGPSVLTPTPQQSQSAIDAITQNREISSRAEESLRQQDNSVKVNDKFFVVKSLTVEDLELSARNGIWATQAHNEEALNKAYESVDNVYLIFSANKSGEYFGYAKMISPINDESASKLEWKPRVETVVDDPELPRSIPTPATETAPKGRIIDDSARGTIFWEVDSSEDEGLEGNQVDSVVGSPEGNQPHELSAEDLGTGAQTFGRPFKIKWISTDRLPFYRTRGLRNPWNANRDVKIARDGTELETSVGRRLVQMFQRTGPTGVPGLVEGHMSPY